MSLHIRFGASNAAFDLSGQLMLFCTFHISAQCRDSNSGTNSWVLLLGLLDVAVRSQHTLWCHKELTSISCQCFSRHFIYSGASKRRNTLTGLLCCVTKHFKTGRCVCLYAWTTERAIKWTSWEESFLKINTSHFKSLLKFSFCLEVT